MTAPDLETAFARPQETIQWARKAIEELKAEITTFFDEKPHAEVVEVDPETGHDVYKFRLTKPLPRDIARKATEALLHLRHSFDQSLFAACAAISKTPRGNQNFPWRRSPVDLEHVFRGKNCEIPTEFWDIIRGQEPYGTGEGYAGGNDLIRELAEAANTKHSVGVEVTGRVVQFIHPSITGSVLFVEIPIPLWDPVKNEMILAIVSKGANVDNDYQIALQVAFDIPGLLKNMPIAMALSAFAEKADGVAKALKDRSAEVLAK